MIKKMLLLLIIFYGTVHSQELAQLRISGKPEQLSNELIDKSVRDNNGEVCAGLIVVSDLNGLSYQSSLGIVKNNPATGKDFLFLSPEERIIEIFCSGFEPLKIILNEVGIKLKGGEVWQIKVTGYKKYDQIPINILNNPKGAEIYIDNISKGKGTTFETSPGEHLLRIELKGFETLETNITVTTKNTLFNYNLKAIKQEIVELRSVPTGAAIYLDGVHEGETDNQLFRFAGKYKIKLTKSGYIDNEKEIEVKKGGDNSFPFNLTKNISSLVLSITPSDAEIIINNKSYNPSPNIELTPGTHLLVIKKEGYREFKDNITLELNVPLKKSVNLEPITGSLQIKVFPIDAEVRLLKDGKEISKWKGAKIIDDLMIENYDLESNLSGYENNAKRIRIEEGRTTAEEIKLITKKIANENTKNGSDNTGTVYYEGKTYQTVRIGSQTWLKENLDVG